MTRAEVTGQTVLLHQQLQLQPGGLSAADSALLEKAKEMEREASEVYLDEMEQLAEQRALVAEEKARLEKVVAQLSRADATAHANKTRRIKHAAKLAASVRKAKLGVVGLHVVQEAGAVTEPGTPSGDKGSPPP